VPAEEFTMKGIVAPTIAAAVLLTLAAEASAQDFTRRQFAFFERQLAIEVSPASAGALHVVRGRAGQLEIRSRSTGGFAAYGLGGLTRDRLRLTPVGAERAEYLVVVPEHVRVRISFPDRIVDVPAYEAATSYAWDAVAPEAEPPAIPVGVGATANAPVALALAERWTARTAYRVHAAASPRSLVLADEAALRRLEVRIGGDEFAIATTRPLSLRPGDPSRLELRLGRQPIDVVVQVPAGATFRLSADGRDVLSVRGGAGDTQCDGVTVQRLASEQRFTFTTERGRLACGPARPVAPPGTRVAGH
jgi:hypothetical protein